MKDKVKILYIVSSLKRTGPVNQLYYIISGLDLDKYECKVLTLSPEPDDSKIESYKKLGVKVDSLLLSRIQGIVLGKSRLSRYIKSFSPNIIQTQGVRADSLILSLSPKASWITTSRNFPIEDYPSKFGRFKGSLMANKHINVLSRCNYLVSCSNSIASKLAAIGISSTVISNGVPPSNINPKKVDIPQSSGVRFVTVGSLIPRKNMGYLVKLSNKLDEMNIEHELIVLGDGPLLNELKDGANSRVKFIGKVENVDRYLAGSDVFLSSSLSEGLPNTVLEAISYGVPVILSDIPSHCEISDKLPKYSSHVFSLNTLPENFALEIRDIVSKMSSINRSDLAFETDKHFGSKAMSEKYQALYEVAVNGSTF